MSKDPKTTTENEPEEVEVNELEEQPSILDPSFVTVVEDEDETEE